MLTVYETLAYRVDHCKEYQAQIERGVMGCHQFEKCPDCVITPEGVEYWGENGHRQATLSEPVSMEYAEKRGWIVKNGGRVHYQGVNL